MVHTLRVILISGLLPLFLCAAASSAATNEEQLLDEVTNYDFAPRACLTADEERAWQQRDFSSFSRNSQALDSHIGQQVSLLKLKYLGRVSKSIKGEHYPKCGNWCRKYPMRFAGTPPVMDSLDQTCKNILTCYQQSDFSCDCFRDFAYDIYANRDPAQALSENEQYVFSYFSQVSLCNK